MVEQKVNRKLPKGVSFMPDTGDVVIGSAENVLYSKDATGFFLVKSDGFIIGDADSILFLSKYFSHSDTVRILLLACMAKETCCVLCRFNIPYTPVTLAAKLGIKPNEWYTISRRLIDKGILWRGVCLESGYGKQKVYILNPYIIPNRNLINAVVKNLFKSVSELIKAEQKNIKKKDGKRISK